MRSIVIIFMLTLSISALAAPCRPSENQPFALLELTSLIRNPECKVKSIDDVLGVIPEHMKSRFSLFYRSQSLQGPHNKDFIYPRAILSSVQKSYEPYNWKIA